MIKQWGMSLVELMVSLFLSCLIMTVILEHYLNCKRQFIETQDLLERNADLQIISEMIRDSSRLAGFTPCISIDRLNTGVAQLQAIKTDFGARHALVINRMNEHFSEVIQILSPSSLLVNRLTVFDGHLLLIADCFHAEVLKITAMQPTPAGLHIMIERPMIFTYNNPVYIGEWLEEQFFIEKNSRGQLSLFYYNRHADELTEQINTLSAVSKGSLLEVSLGVKGKKPLLIATRVRA